MRGAPRVPNFRSGKKPMMADWWPENPLTDVDCQDHIIGLRLSLSAEDIAEGRPGDRLSLFPLESLQRVTVWARNIYCQVIDISFMRRVSHILLAWALLVPSAMAIRELVELEELQPAQQVEGIILRSLRHSHPKHESNRLHSRVDRHTAFNYI